MSDDVCSACGDPSHATIWKDAEREVAWIYLCDDHYSRFLKMNKKRRGDFIKRIERRPGT